MEEEDNLETLTNAVDHEEIISIEPVSSKREHGPQLMRSVIHVVE